MLYFIYILIFISLWVFITRRDYKNNDLPIGSESRLTKFRKDLLSSGLMCLFWPLTISGILILYFLLFVFKTIPASILKRLDRGKITEPVQNTRVMIPADDIILNPYGNFKDPTLN